MTPRRKETSRYEPTKHEGLFRDKRSGIYYLRDTIQVDAERSEWVDRSLKTKQISVALDRMGAIKAKLIRGELEERSKRHTFEEAFDLLIKIQGSKADKTEVQAKTQIDPHLRPWFKENCPYLTGPAKRYKDGFERQFPEVWADYQREASGRKPPSYLKTPEAIEAWLAQPENQKPRSLDHDRRYLVMALKRAQTRGWVKRLFKKKDFELTVITDPIGKFIEPEDVKSLLRAAKPHRKLFIQVRIALQLGMRHLEILHLSKEEVNLKRQEIDLNPRRVKTRRRREVPIPIPDDLFPLIEEAYEEAPGPYLFPAEHHNVEGRPVDPTRPQSDNSYHWDKVRAATGVDARFHDLRHTCITNLLVAGVPDIAVRKICGVSEQTMRRIYAHIETQLKDRFKDALRGIYVE